MKKSLLCLFIAVLSVFMIATFSLAGCKKEAAETTAAETTAAETTAAETTAAKEVSIKVLHIAGPEADVLQEQLPDFTEKTGIKVQMDIATRDDMPVRLLRELIEGQGTYDAVLGLSGSDYAPYVNKGNYIPIEDYMTPDEVEQFYARSNFTDPRTGKMAGIPQYHNWEMLFYRSDLLNDPDEQTAFKAKYGRDLAVPTTYEELAEVAEFFTRPPDMYGYMIGGTDWSLMCDYNYALFGEGGNYGDKDGNLTLNTPEQIKAMTELVGLTKFCPPGWETQTFMDGDTLMLEGKVFMYQNWFYIWSTFQKEMAGKIDMAPPIQGGAQLSGWLALIPKSSPNPDAAAEFLKWEGSFDIQKQHVLKLGNLPARSDVLQDPEVREALAGIEMFEQAAKKTSIPLITWEAELLSAIHEAFFMVVNGEKTAEEAMNWLQNEKFAGRKAIE